MSQQQPPLLLLPKVTEGIEPSSAAAFVGLLTFALFASSVIYDWGYLAALGLTFSDIPLTLADITQGALHWLPGIIVTLFALIALEIVTRRVEGGKTEDELAPRETAPRMRALRDWTAMLVPIAWSVSCILLFIAIGEPAIAFLVGACASLWMTIAFWVVRHPVIGGGMDLVRRRAFYFGPSIAVILFGLGWHFGLQALLHPRDTATIHIADGSTQVVPLIRSYEHGVLFRRNDRMEFRRWDKVEAISMPARRHYWSGIITREREHGRGET